MGTAIIFSSLKRFDEKLGRRCAGRTLAKRAMLAPVVEIIDILGQDPDGAH